VLALLADRDLSDRGSKVEMFGATRRCPPERCSRCHRRPDRGGQVLPDRGGLAHDRAPAADARNTGDRKTDARDRGDRRAFGG
jgi:hypothetical protein